VRNSRCFGLYDVSNGRQIGLTRVVTDYATFAWICDVIVEEAYRGSRLGVWMMETVLADPQLSGVRRWTLATRDAHELYARFGFNPLAHPGNWMEIRPGP
jgi:GNAT superfamily N-acetyltransferase